MATITSNEANLVERITDLATQIPKAQQLRFIDMLEGVVFATKYGRKSK